MDILGGAAARTSVSEAACAWVPLFSGSGTLLCKRRTWNEERAEEISISIDGSTVSCGRIWDNVPY